LADDEFLTFGTGSDWAFEYDEDGDDQFVLATNNDTAIADTDPMFEIRVDNNTASGTNMDADQEVFGVSKGTQAANVALMTLDEDGDVVFAGTLEASGTITSGSSATPTVNFKDSDATDGDVNARIYVNCTDPNTTTEDCDLTIAQQEAGTEKNILVADADDGISLGAAGRCHRHHRGR
jgi:hypothetical protein